MFFICRIECSFKKIYWIFGWYLNRYYLMILIRCYNLVSILRHGCLFTKSQSQRRSGDLILPHLKWILILSWCFYKIFNKRVFSKFLISYLRWSCSNFNASKFLSQSILIVSNFSHTWYSESQLLKILFILNITSRIKKLFPKLIQWHVPCVNIQSIFITCLPELLKAEIVEWTFVGIFQIFHLI